MWVNKINKAESFATLGHVRDALDILDQFKRNRKNIDSDPDIGLALHGLGNAFLRNGNFDEGDQAFELAIEVRRNVLENQNSLEIINHLAGSYKMRAVTRLLKLRQKPNNRLLQEARSQIDEALRIRQELLPLVPQTSEDYNDFLHDYAMTQNTKGNIEGMAWNFSEAMPALEQSVKIMEKLIIQHNEWYPDLGICLADRVLFGVGAQQRSGQPPPLMEAEECFSFYKRNLSNQLLENYEVQTKYFQFLGQAAAPAAAYGNRLDRACVFIEAGLDLIEEIRLKYGNMQNLQASALHLFSLPSDAVKNMVNEGLDIKRFNRLFKEVYSSFGGGK